MDRARFDSWLEKGILGLVTLILVLGPVLFGSTPVYFIVIHYGLVAAALVLWTVRFWVRQEYRVLWPPFAWGVVAFLIYALWQLSRADVEYPARLDVNRVILYAGLFFLILDNLNRQEWTQYLVCLLIFMGMAVSMYALYQFLTGSKYVLYTPQYVVNYGRASGTFISPNHLAGYLALILPLAFALMLMARFKPVTKVFLGYAAIVMLGGLLVTISRAGIAAAILGLVVLFTILLFHRDFRIPAAVALVVIIVPALWVGMTSAKMKARLNKGVASGQLQDDRFNVWPAAREMWRANFWTGVGPNHFDIRFRQLRPPLGQLQTRPIRVHNDYLNTLADWGMIGFSIIAAAWGIFWISVLRIWRYVRRANDFGSKQSTRAAIVLGSCAGLIAILAHIIVDFDMHIPAIAMALVAILAIVTGHWRFATERFWVRPGIVGRVLATAVCLAGAIWLGQQALRLGREQYYLAKADRNAGSPDLQIEFLKKAFAVEPKNGATAYRIGELLRLKSWSGVGEYRSVAEEAMTWFDKSIAVDKFAPHGYLGRGMCLHWLERPHEAWPYFRQAILLDPNSYYARAIYGWHFMQLGAWQPAAKWFLFSRFLNKDENPIANAYWEIALRKLEEEKQGPVLSKPLPERSPDAATEDSSEAPPEN